MSNTEIPLSGMTVQQKLQLMERLWVDLSQNTDDLPSPDWHRDLLEQRQQAVLLGKTSFESWETARQALLNRHK